MSTRLGVFILPLLAAGFYLNVGIDYALAFSIGLIANHSTESSVVTIACNPGSPNCIPYDPNSRLGKVKGQLKDQGSKIGGDEQDCQSKLCGIDTGNGTSPAAAKRAPKTKGKVGVTTVSAGGNKQLNGGTTTILHNSGGGSSSGGKH